MKEPTCPLSNFLYDAQKCIIKDSGEGYANVIRNNAVE